MLNHFYTPLDIAVVINNMSLPLEAEGQILLKIWNEEHNMIQPEYRSSFRKFVLQVRYWIAYLYDKPTLDREFPSVQSEIAQGNIVLDPEQYVSDYFSLDLYFKNVRLKIIYGKGNKYVRIKLRTLLKKYGYKRRSPNLVKYINECLKFYHLTPYLKGRVKCRIANIKIDDMITFRLRSKN